MTKAQVGGTAPIVMDVEAGKDYWWCSCGQSKKQPSCDGSHKGTTFSPVKWTAGESRKVAFCTCKQTGKSPICDGTHKAL